MSRDCWTEPELLKQSFAPKTWSVAPAELDVRVGGANCITMRSPDGQEMPGRGVYRDVVPYEKLVFTDAFDRAWVPKDGPPFMVATVTPEDEGEQTRYPARVQHWS